MIPPVVIKFFAAMPCLGLFVYIYWLLCWWVPKELADNKLKGIVISHCVLLIFIWVVWSVFWMDEKHDNYEKQYIDFQEESQR